MNPPKIQIYQAQLESHGVSPDLAHQVAEILATDSVPCRKTPQQAALVYRAWLETTVMDAR